MEHICENCGQSFARKTGLDYHRDHPEQCVRAVKPDITNTAAGIARTAADLVGGDRQVTHGDKSINFANTADMWNAILQVKARRMGYTALELIGCLDALDVANMLEAFKIARRYSGSHNLDDYVDGCGYAACAGEIAERQSR